MGPKEYCIRGGPNLQGFDVAFAKLLWPRVYIYLRAWYKCLFFILYAFLYNYLIIFDYFVVCLFVYSKFVFGSDA